MSATLLRMPSTSTSSRTFWWTPERCSETPYNKDNPKKEEKIWKLFYEGFFSSESQGEPENPVILWDCLVSLFTVTEEAMSNKNIILGIVGLRAAAGTRILASLVALDLEKEDYFY